MTTNEGFAVYSKIITRTRELQLEKLKRENSVLRAKIALAQFYYDYSRWWNDEIDRRNRALQVHGGQ